MKKLLAVFFVVAALALPAAAQLRLDIGVEIPKGVGLAASGEVSTFGEAAQILQNYWVPFPSAGLYYQFDLGMFKLGAGLRCYTAIVASVGWPNLYGEFVLGPLVVEAQAGGGVFGWYALNQGGFETGKVFIPDLSAWLALGKKKIFRIGGGAFGLYLPELTGSDTLPFVLYFGCKAAIPL
jgi:hypothetical protein